MKIYIAIEDIEGLDNHIFDMENQSGDFSTEHWPEINDTIPIGATAELEYGKSMADKDATIVTASEIILLSILRYSTIEPEVYLWHEEDIHRMYLVRDDDDRWDFKRPWPGEYGFFEHRFELLF